MISLKERDDLVAAARRLNSLTEEALSVENVELAAQLVDEEVAIMVAICTIDKAKLVQDTGLK